MNAVFVNHVFNPITREEEEEEKKMTVRERIKANTTEQNRAEQSEWSVEQALIYFAF